MKFDSFFGSYKRELLAAAGLTLFFVFIGYLKYEGTRDKVQVTSAFRIGRIGSMPIDDYEAIRMKIRGHHRQIQNGSISQDVLINRGHVADLVILSTAGTANQAELITQHHEELIKWVLDGHRKHAMEVMHNVINLISDIQRDSTGKVDISKSSVLPVYVSTEIEILGEIKDLKGKLAVYLTIGALMGVFVSCTIFVLYSTFFEKFRK